MIQRSFFKQDRPKCQAAPQACVFPFIYQGRTHWRCVDSSLLDAGEGGRGGGDGGRQSYYKWCAIGVDQSNQMIPGMWGECGKRTSCSQTPGKNNIFWVNIFESRLFLPIFQFFATYLKISVHKILALVHVCTK